jgi:hypothetical protein
MALSGHYLMSELSLLSKVKGSGPSGSLAEADSLAAMSAIRLARIV